MDLGNGIKIDTLLPELFFLMVRVIRIVGDLLREINFITEMVEAGKEVITPTHEVGTGKKIETSLPLRKARDDNLLKRTQFSGHDPTTTITLVFRTRIPHKAQISLPMNRSSHNTIIRRSLM